MQLMPNKVSQESKLPKSVLQIRITPHKTIRELMSLSFLIPTIIKTKNSLILSLYKTLL